MVEKKRHFLLSFTRHTSHSALNHSVLDLRFRIPLQMKQFSSNQERSFVISSVFHRHDQRLAKECGTTFSANQWQKQIQLRIARPFPRLAPAPRICFALSLARLTICTCCNWTICFFVFFFVARFQDCRSMESFFPHRKNSFYAATYESYLNRSHSRRQNQSLVIRVNHYHNTN